MYFTDTYASMQAILHCIWQHENYRKFQHVWQMSEVSGDAGFAAINTSNK